MMLRRQDLLIEVLQRIGLRYKTRLDLRSEFQVKSLPSFERLVVIGYLTLNSKRKKVLIHQSRRQLVERYTDIFVRYSDLRSGLDYEHTYVEHSFRSPTSSI